MKNLYYLAVLGLIALSACGNRPEKTIANLQQANKEELTASARYTAFAAKAREEGYETVAKLLEAVSRSERVHAERFEELLDALDVDIPDVQPAYKLETTEQNLVSALAAEAKDVDSWYLKCKTDAYSEKQIEAAENFLWSLNAEKQHIQYLQKCLNLLRKSPDSLKALPLSYLICPICGMVSDSSNVKNVCQSCTTPKDIFLQQ